MKDTKQIFLEKYPKASSNSIIVIKKETHLDNYYSTDFLKKYFQINI